MNRDFLLVSGDAELVGYVKDGDQLTLRLKLWNGQELYLLAHGVTRIVENGTWEAEGLLRLPQHDGGGKKCFGIVDVEDVITMHFLADGVETR